MAARLDGRGRSQGHRRVLSDAAARGDGRRLGFRRRLERDPRRRRGSHAQRRPGSTLRRAGASPDDQSAGGARRASAARGGAPRRVEATVRAGDRKQREARAVQEPDPARDHGRGSAGHGRRRAEPPDVRHGWRRAQGLHARRDARDRRVAERRRQRDLARRSHRRRAIRARRARLFELGALGRSRERVAPRARGGRHEREQGAACRGPRLVVAARCRGSVESDESAHQPRRVERQDRAADSRATRGARGRDPERGRCRSSCWGRMSAPSPKAERCYRRQKRLPAEPQVAQPDAVPAPL